LTLLRVTFTAAGKQTLVSLTHSGWEIFDDPAGARSGYDQGWVEVLGRYAELASGPGGDGGEQTVADEDGAGMTILRLPGAGQEGLASVLATSDDAAVREGLLSVTVRPWQVIMNVLPSSA
jgi:hypothetical protein